MIVLGLIISGGLIRGEGGNGTQPENASDSVELLKLNAETGKVQGSCALPRLPVTRGAHSMVTNTACGGFTGQQGLDTCTSLTGGQWTQTHTLASTLYMHTTWQIPDGTVLLGGVGGEYRADLLKPIPETYTESLFNLRYLSRYNVNLIAVNEIDFFWSEEAVPWLMPAPSL